MGGAAVDGATGLAPGLPNQHASAATASTTATPRRSPSPKPGRRAPRPLSCTAELFSQGFTATDALTRDTSNKNPKTLKGLDKQPHQHDESNFRDFDQIPPTTIALSCDQRLGLGPTRSLVLHLERILGICGQTEGLRQNDLYRQGQLNNHL